MYQERVSWVYSFCYLPGHIEEVQEQASEIQILDFWLSL